MCAERLLRFEGKGKQEQRWTDDAEPTQAHRNNGAQSGNQKKPARSLRLSHARDQPENQKEKKERKTKISATLSLSSSLSLCSSSSFSVLFVFSFFPFLYSSFYSFSFPLSKCCGGKLLGGFRWPCCEQQAVLLWPRFASLCRLHLLAQLTRLSSSVTELGFSRCGD